VATVPAMRHFHFGTGTTSPRGRRSR
jgi:hypothetical protein